MKKKLIIELKKLINILKKNKIWYAAEAGTLLGTVREQGMIPWDDDIDLMITFAGYQKLKKLFPKNVLDSSVEGYPFLFPKWVNKIENFDQNFDANLVAIDLFLVIPTNEKRYLKFTNWKNKLIFSIQVLNKSKFNKYSWGLKILALFQWPFAFLVKKKITIEKSYKILFEPNKSYVENNVLLVNPLDNYYVKNTPLDNFKTQKMLFENMQINVPTTYDAILTNRYGLHYLIPLKPKKTFEHISAISVKWRKVQ